MKLSYKILQDYINCPLMPEELANKLIMAGLEVGAIEKKGGNLTRCVVGQILEINPHPQADRLTVCRVNIGNELLTIVCGAKNMKVSDKVPVALVGCNLPVGLRIQRSKLRGVTSEGMMCSEEELKLSDESPGLLILPADAPLGVEISRYLGLDDVVLEVELTPNRGDCLSIQGIVREIAVLTGQKAQEMKITLAEEEGKIEDLLSIQVEDPDLCPRYTARVISGVKIGPSPVWLVQKLKAMGYRSINNVVDVTNFVMMELGQPLHAFDYDLVDGGQVIVRRAKENETIVTLDNLERRLSQENLVIADKTKPIALAGVMGGANSEVSEKTEKILLESAFFDHVSIRRTAHFFGLHSEASHRFERRIDPEGVIPALNRATQLIVEVAGGKVAKGIIDVYPVAFVPRTIILSLAHVYRVLGLEVPEEAIIKILQGLGFSINRLDQLRFEVHVPLYRWDIEREVDLIEEIARIYGYENIPVSLPKGVISPQRKTKLRDFEIKIKNTLVGLGFSEAINYSFISQKVLDDLPETGIASGERINLKNPLAEDQNVMRNSLMAGLCQNIAFNQNRQVENIRLFEMGHCFFSSDHGFLPTQKMRLAVVMQGSREPRSWRGKNELLTFFDLKGIVEVLMLSLRISDYKIIPSDHAWLSSAQVCSLCVSDKPIGYLGKVGKEILDYFDLKGDIFALEFDLDLLNPDVCRRFKPIPKYPSVTRDLALVIREDIPYQKVEQSIRDMGIEILKDICLFDLYIGDQISPGNKSLGLSLIYQSLDRTLTDKEVNLIHEKIIDHLGQKFKASLRI